MAVFEFPLSPSAQQMTVPIGARELTFRFAWSDSPAGGWFVDISSIDGTPLVRGLPLTAGENVLQQFNYLGIGGAIHVQTDVDPLVEPTYDNLGLNGRVFLVMP
jgi:hypothetical protein